MFALSRLSARRLAKRYSAGFNSLMKSRTGATAIEYALIAVLISIASVVAFQLVGNSVNDMFGMMSSNLEETERCMEVDSSCNK